MRKIAVLGVVAGCIAATAAVAQGASSGSVSFSVIDKPFVMPLPEGFCRPTEAQLASARETAALDPANHTPLNINLCGTQGDNYILIKYPRTITPLDMPKRDFLQAVAAEFQTAAGQAELDRGSAEARDNLSDASNGQVALGEQSIRYSGVDDDCVYLSGIIEISTPEVARTARVGTCMTLIGDRHMAIHSYDFTRSLTIDQLKARSAAVSRSITAQ